MLALGSASLTPRRALQHVFGTVPACHQLSHLPVAGTNLLPPPLVSKADTASKQEAVTPVSRSLGGLTIPNPDELAQALAELKEVKL